MKSMSCNSSAHLVVVNSLRPVGHAHVKPFVELDNKQR